MKVKSILKSTKSSGQSLNLIDKASDFAPLAAFHLRIADWLQAAALKSQAVLTKLRRGEAPHSLILHVVSVDFLFSGLEGFCVLSAH